MSYIENSNKNNKQSIQILRGNNDTIVANYEDKLLDGQLLYNKDKNYITVGNNNKSFNAQPICVRELHGWAADDSSISGSTQNGEFFIKHNEDKDPPKKYLHIYSQDNILLKTSYGDIKFIAGDSYKFKSLEDGSNTSLPFKYGDSLTLSEIYSASSGNTTLNITDTSTGGLSLKSNVGIIIEKIFFKDESISSFGDPININSNINCVNINCSGTIIGQIGNISTRKPIYCTSISAEEGINGALIRGHLYGTLGASNDRAPIWCGVINSNGNITCGDKIILNTNGEITAQSFNAQSDARLKTNIKPLTYHDSILDIPVREYDWKESGKHAIGFIAQELKEVYPELVDENEEGILSIKETKLVYLLIEEVKKLKEEIQELKK